jgi:tRNA threonylcarbamoyladenosine biosynthesis protein TsaE
MKPTEFLSKSPEETRSIAEKLSKEIKPGTILCLFGDLGAGKTTFVQGLAKGLKVKKSETVQSPTFVVMNIYHGKLPIYHFDLYRLKDMQQIALLGYEVSKS